MASTDVKQGDRVVYAIGDVEYNGVALGTVTTGVHPGHKRASKHLNLIYLNEQGTPVKIFGAPLLTAAETIEDKALFAQMNARLERQAPDGHELRTVEGQVKAKEESPRKIGWRTFVDGEEVASLKAQLATAQASLASVTGERDALLEQLIQLAQLPPAVTGNTATAQASLASVTGERDALLEQLKAAESAAPAAAYAGTGDPSAADLDAAVADQAAAAATGDPAPAGETGPAE